MNMEVQTQKSNANHSDKKPYLSVIRSGHEFKIAQYAWMDDCWELALTYPASYATTEDADKAGQRLGAELSMFFIPATYK